MEAIDFLISAPNQDFAHGSLVQGVTRHASRHNGSAPQRACDQMIEFIQTTQALNLKLPLQLIETIVIHLSCIGWHCIGCIGWAPCRCWNLQRSTNPFIWFIALNSISFIGYTQSHLLVIIQSHLLVSLSFLICRQSALPRTIHSIESLLTPWVLYIAWLCLTQRIHLLLLPQRLHPAVS